jgi:hypothetical protein
MQLLRSNSSSRCSGETADPPVPRRTTTTSSYSSSSRGGICEEAELVISFGARVICLVPHLFWRMGIATAYRELCWLHCATYSCCCQAVQRWLACH